MTTTPKGRDRPRHQLCGWCGNAARSPHPLDTHRRCYGPCDCGKVGHRFTPDMAAAMGRVSHLPIDLIYKVHGRKRRVLTDDQKAAATARLTAYRERQTA